MQNSDKMICIIFETEMWLYIDNALTDDKMEFWRVHLRGCSKCREMLNQSEELSSPVQENELADLDDTKYDVMVSKALKHNKQSFFGSFFKSKNKNIVSIGKIVFATALVVASVLISLLSDKPNSMKSFGKEILDWEGRVVISEIEKITNRIKMINESDWNKQMIMLDEKIELIEKDTNKLSFN